jgi:PAS domain S-box-containing protein
MTPLLSLLNALHYLKPPPSLTGWLGWLFMLGIAVAALIRWRRYQQGLGRRILLMILLVFLVPLTGLFLGVRLSPGAALPVPGIPEPPHSPVLMLFSALPWMLAGGFLGPISAAIVGLLTGLVRGLWDTHNLFSLLEPVLLAVLFSVAVRQPYRTPLYRLLRQPLVVAIGLLPVYALIFVFGAFFSILGALAVRLDYALTNVAPAMLAASGELLVAGIFAQVIAAASASAWGHKEALQPSPAERSMETRFLFGGVGFVALLLVSMLAGAWVVAGRSARQMLRDRMTSTAQVVAESLPYFLETGQTLAVQLASDPRLLTESGAQLNALLEQELLAIPFFDQFIILDSSSSLLAAYPSEGAAPSLARDEVFGVSAASSISVQYYPIPPTADGKAARVSFIAAIRDGNGQLQRILLARSDLAVNPLTRSLVNSLDSMKAFQGKGLLLDEQGRILYPPDREMLRSDYPVRGDDSSPFFERTAPDGTRNLVYYRPVVGYSWSVVLSVPAKEAQQLALNIAAPLSALLLVLAVIALVVLRLGLRVVTASLKDLAGEATRIAQGQLDHPLPVVGVDEVGQLGRAFEQMRIRLRLRLDELAQLLLVSQGVASSLELQDASQPVLQAVLATGASAVRVALNPSGAQFGEETPLHLALGPAKDNYAYLDDQILALVQKQEQLVLTNVARMRGLDLPPDRPHPASLLALALQHKKRRYGVLWAAYDQPRTFSDEEVRFISTLAGQAALAAANARLFRSAEVGRQRLAAILASTPDPVLVTDQHNRLLLANPAAKQALGAAAGPTEGEPTERVIPQSELVRLLQIFETAEQSAEVRMPDDRLYYATACPVIAEGKMVGRVCVLRDITRFKELDALKSDFVATVSHDLRSPLTVMRGYATMLDMANNLTGQQKEYTNKIMVGVESMARIINNLLDLGRIEAGVGLQVEELQAMESVEATISALRPLAAQKNILLAVEAQTAPPRPIQADRLLLQQALSNLVDNAVKYTPKGGGVRLTVKERSDGLLFEVQDTGIGIAPLDQPRLFEKFYRAAQPEARQQRGSGLGLAIVRSIAERHHGKVWVESQLGKGSTFFLLIPYRQPKAKEETQNAL